MTKEQLNVVDKSTKYISLYGTDKATGIVLLEIENVNRTRLTDKYKQTKKRRLINLFNQIQNDIDEMLNTNNAVKYNESDHYGFD